MDERKYDLWKLDNGEFDNYEVCHKCSGDKVVDCPECLGEGKWHIGYEEECICEKCKGKLVISCKYCKL